MIRASYWPASVRLPDGQVWHRVRVYITDQLAHVFTEPAEHARWVGVVDRDRTVLPAAPPRSAGIDIALTDGSTLVVTVTGGCGCGNPLRRWLGPSWAQVEGIRGG